MQRKAFVAHTELWSPILKHSADLADEIKLQQGHDDSNNTDRRELHYIIYCWIFWQCFGGILITESESTRDSYIQMDYQLSSNN